MSGLEVAGVVLGAIPLVIAALEHYATGINTAKRFWFYKAQVEKLIDRIETQQTMYVNTLEELLIGIVKNEEIAELLADVDSKMWKASELDERLRDRLRGAYKVYFTNVKGMESALKKMMAKLALDPDGKPQFTDPSLFKQEYKRLKFCLSETEYNKHLSDMQTHNQALERLTAQSLKLEPSRAESSSRSCPNYNALRDYARNVFETLRSGLSCTCNNHAVKLRLESRNQRGDAEQLLEKAPLRVIFTLSSSNVQINVPTTHSEWREADIKVLTESQRGATTASVVSIATSKSVRRVRFDASGSSSSVQLQAPCNTTAPNILTSMQTPVITPATAAQIQDLCRAIAAAHIHSPPSSLCSGYLLDSCNRKHGIYLLSSPETNAVTSHTWAAYTLRQVLTKHVNVSRPLTQLDKFTVAVDLASSVLQLYKTPWLEESWDEDDVYFVHRPGTPLSSIYQHPFIYRKLSSSTTHQPCMAPKPARRVIRNQTLFTLGVLLIELLYAKPVEELQTTHDLDCQGTPGVVWCTAERLIEEEILFEAGPLFSDAVRRCIRCDFNHANHDLDDRDFQQIVFDGVVAPLEKTLQRFKGLE